MYMYRWTIFLIIYLKKSVCEINHVSSQVYDEDIIDLSFYGSSLYGQPSMETGKIISGLKWTNSTTNPEELGEYLEGDILVPKKMSRNGINYEFYRWKNGIIPFEIQGSFNAFEMDLIEKALNEYHTKTCIKFIRRRNTDVDYISIQNKMSGCWSSVGKVGNSQIVNLQSPGCVSKIGTVIHELMHTVGFMHEHTREERDNYIYIITNNIQSGYENNFSKASEGMLTSFGVPYDYFSVMHYSPNAFSKNDQPTIVPKSETNGKMGQRDGFSYYDIEKINRMYNCKVTQQTKAPKSQTSQSGSSKPIKPSPSIGNLIWNFILPNITDEHDKNEFI